MSEFFSELESTNNTEWGGSILRKQSFQSDFCYENKFYEIVITDLFNADNDRVICRRLFINDVLVSDKINARKDYREVITCIYDRFVSVYLPMYQKIKQEIVKKKIFRNLEELKNED